MSKPREYDSAQIEAAFKKFGEALTKATKEMRTSAAVGHAVGAYRARELAKSAAAIHRLDREERDLVLRWCAYMIGFGDDAE